jgi:acyl-CoA synthetase (NDP forming)
VSLNLTGLDALLRPSSVAVLGASSDPAKIGGRPIRFLRQNGFAGEIYPVNPGHAEVQGLRAYPTITAVGRPVDLALISVPGPAVLDAVSACAESGVRVATIFSAGFAEASPEGAVLQEQIASIAAASGLRVLGPNCLGSASHRRGVSASFAASEARPRPPENVAGVGLISQSGAVASYCVLAGLDRGITFDPWISTGNECDIQLADCLAYLAMDDDVRVIAAYMEGCRDGDRLREALALAYERKKPVVLLKAGRSEVGARAAASHTASLVGSEETFAALVRQYNVCLADSLDDLMDLSYMFAFGSAPAGTRTGIVTSSGGVGILMADQAHDEGLTIPPLPDEAQAALRSIWPAAGVGNPIDTTAQLVQDRELLSSFLETVLRDGQFDSVIIFLSYIGLIPEWSQAAVDALRGARKAFPDADISLAMLATPEVRRSVEELGIRVFDDPTKAIRALGRGVASVRGFDRPPALPSTGPGPSTVPLPGQGALSELESSAFLEDAGIPVAPRRLVASAAEAGEAARAFGGEVVLKVVSADLPHKTEAGGVVLGVGSPEQAAEAYTRILDAVRAHAPDASIDGVLVSPMITGGVETIIGVVNDPVFGPTVMFGLGGVFVESLRDVTFRLAPFTTAEARQMIREIRGHGILEGARGSGTRDLDALAEAISTLSVIADEHRQDIESIDLNPFLVLADGAVAVDALITRRTPDRTGAPDDDQ